MHYTPRPISCTAPALCQARTGGIREISRELGDRPGGRAKIELPDADASTLANLSRDFEGMAHPLRGPKPHLISINADQTWTI